GKFYVIGELGCHGWRRSRYRSIAADRSHGLSRVYLPLAKAACVCGPDKIAHPWREPDRAMTTGAPRSGMPGHLGIRITEAAKDRLVGEMDADAQHLNVGGVVHGGALAAFADDLGGTLASLTRPRDFAPRQSSR